MWARVDVSATRPVGVEEKNRMTLNELVKAALEQAQGWSEFEAARVIEAAGAQTVEEALDVLACEAQLRRS